MKIYRPVLSDSLYQGFGENLACVKVDSQNQPLRPFEVIPGTFIGICPPESTKFYPAIGMLGHNGWDNAAYHGEPIYFPVVEDTAWKAYNEVDADGGIGVNVYAQTPIAFNTIPQHTQGSFRMIEHQYETLGGKLFPLFKFWHLLRSNVKDGDIVKAGDLIGYADTTGASSGDHLHWSMKIHGGSVQGYGLTIDSDNGYTGAMDHRAYYENRFILDIAKPTFKFNKVLKRGMYDSDVGILQSILVKYGYMKPIKAEESGFYGPKTQGAVLAFQIGEKLPLSWYERNIMAGNTVGPKTIARLNELL